MIRYKTFTISPRSFKLLISAIATSFVVSQCIAQEFKGLCFKQDPQKGPLFSSSLNKVPQFKSVIKDSASVNGLLLVTTIQLNKDSAVKQYNSTLQLIDPKNPYPPLWFCSIDDAHGGGLADAKLQDDGTISVFLNAPQISYSLPKEIPADDEKSMLSGYLELDSKFMPKQFFGLVGIGFNDYRITARGERIAIRNGEHRERDLSALAIAGHQLSKETMVDAETVEIFDSQNNIIFKWNPLDHMDVTEMDFEKYGSMTSHSPDFKYIQFSRISSAAIDPEDGNVLISLLKSDECVKVNRKTGDILWRLGGKKSDFIIAENEKFILQRDFKRITGGPFKGCFSLLSNGEPGKSKAEGLIYKLDETGKKAALVARYPLLSYQTSTGQGNFDVYSDSTVLLNYGTTNSSVAGKDAANIVLYKSGKEIGLLQAPAGTTTFRAQWLKDFKYVQPALQAGASADGYSPQPEKGYNSYYWSNQDSLKLKNASGLPVIYYKVPAGIGFAVSQKISPSKAQNNLKVNYPLAIGGKQSNENTTSKCNLNVNFNDNTVGFKNTLVSLEKILILFKPE